MKRKYLAVVPALGSAFLVLALAAPAAAQAAGPFQFHSLTPCRIVDTRLPAQTVGQYGPVLQSGVERKFPVQGNCGVPVGAKAATLNVTVAAPTNQGNLRLFPSGIVAPNVSTINFPPGTSALANGAIVPLADQSLQPSDLAVLPTVVSNGQVHLILDVTGYFQ